jgi:hypothetical protein
VSRESSVVAAVCMVILCDDGKVDSLEREKKDNRSKSKNRKPTIIKLTTTKNPKKSKGRDEQTKKK